METRISQLKTNFGNISDIRSQVKNFFEILQIRINKLKLFYSEFIKNNKSELFVFGLDSLHFQSKLIDIEYDDMKRLFMAINNRMYCEYFKLYKIIVAYIIENTFDKKIMELIKVNNFPVYKDLEPFKEYEFNTVLEIHENILLMLNAIIGYLEGKEHELTFHIVKKNIGLNIDNFISSFSFDITVIKEKINLFITYIEFFHKLHTKQLQRFSNKIQLMYSHVNKDIRFDESIDINDKKKKSNSFEKIEKSSVIYNIDNSSDTDDSNSLNSPFVNTNQNFTSNPLLIITNNNSYNTDDETTNQNQLNEAFSNIENKCDLILNSNISSDVPGVTIEQINEYVNVTAPIQEQENISIVINDEELSLQNENNNEINLETQFFAFKPLEQNI
jgi:hypothetical protein